MSDETERAIDEALAGRPRAEELAEMIAALEVRRETFQRERDAAAPAERETWEARMREAERQIEVLREEQAITEFVENSVRVTVNRPHPDDLE
jgi:hypothetical protein